MKKSTLIKMGLLVPVAGMLFPMAHADAGTFDYTTYSTILTAGAVVVATVAGSLGAIKAGVLVWGKIAKYFSKSG